MCLQLKNNQVVEGVGHQNPDLDVRVSAFVLKRAYRLSARSTRLRFLAVPHGQLCKTPAEPNVIRWTYDTGGLHDKKRRLYDHHAPGLREKNPSAAGMMFEDLCELGAFTDEEKIILARLIRLTDWVDSKVRNTNPEVDAWKKAIFNKITELNREMGYNDKARQNHLFLAYGDREPGYIIEVFAQMQKLVDAGIINDEENIRLGLELMDAWMENELETKERDAYRNVLTPSEDFSHLIGKLLYHLHNSDNLHQMERFNSKTIGFLTKHDEDSQPRMVPSGTIQSLCEIISEVNIDLDANFLVTHKQRGPWRIQHCYDQLGILVRRGQMTPEERDEKVLLLLRSYYMSQISVNKIRGIAFNLLEDQVIKGNGLKIAVFPEMTQWTNEIRYNMSNRWMRSQLGFDVIITERAGEIAVTRMYDEIDGMRELYNELREIDPNLVPNEGIYLFEPNEFVIFLHDTTNISKEQVIELVKKHLRARKELRIAKEALYQRAA